MSSVQSSYDEWHTCSTSAMELTIETWCAFGGILAAISDCVPLIQGMDVDVDVGLSGTDGHFKATLTFLVLQDRP